MKRLICVACGFLVMASLAAAQSVDWSTQFGTSVDERFDAVAVFNGDYYAAGYTEGAMSPFPFWKTRPAGTTVSLRGVEMIDAQVGVAVGFGGTIMRTADGGATWSAIPSGTSENLFDVTFQSPSLGIAVGASGTILRSQDGGQTWGIINTGPPFALLAVDFIDAGNWVAVGSDGTILNSSDGGGNWGAVGSGVPFSLNGIDVISATNIIVTGDSGTILQSPDGALWSPIASPTTQILRGVHFYDTSNGIIVGDGGVVLVTGDGGVSWTFRASNTSDALLQVQMTSASNATAVGVNGTIIHSTDGGQNWSPQSSPTGAGLNDIYFTAPNTAVAVGDGVAISRTNGVGGGRDVLVARYDFDGTQLWMRQFGSIGDDEALAIHVDAGGVYVAGETGGTLPGQVQAGNPDGFIRRYDLSGDESWIVQFGTGDPTSLTGVTGDGSAIYVSGKSSLALAGETGTGAFIRQYSTTGVQGWTDQFGLDANDEATCIGMANGLAIYVAGWTYGSYPGFTNAGDRDIVVRRYDNSGSVQWTRQFGSAAQDYAQGIGVMPDAGVVVCGSTSGALPGQTNGGLTDAWVRRYDVVGNDMWTDQIQTTLESGAQDVSADALGVYLITSIREDLTGQGYAGGIWDVMVRKYDDTGSELWSTQFGTAGEETGEAIAADGDFVFASIFTNGNLFIPSPAGGTDIALVHMNAQDCPPGTSRLYVDDDSPGGDGTSWGQAITELRDALDLAAGCPNITEIWVAEGTYLPTAGGERTATFTIPSGVAVYGGFAGTESDLSERVFNLVFGFNVSVLSGDVGVAFNSSDNSYHVVTIAPGAVPGTRLDGFQITGGNADGGGADDIGAGIYNMDFGAVTMANLYIAYNNAVNLGGGAASQWAASWTGCIFEGNTSGNDGGGLWQDNNANVPVVDCVFLQNTGLHGGAIRSGGAGPYINVVFDGNHANSRGGAVENFGATQFLNCTFVDNTSQFDGPALSTGDGHTVAVTNTIVWDNVSISNPALPQVFSIPGAVHAFSSSLVGGSNGSGPGWLDILGIDAGGNIDADPQFETEEGFENRLTLVSPAVDAGDSGAPNLPATDLDGAPRVQGSAVDMGAYELTPASTGDVLWQDVSGTGVDDEILEVAVDGTGVYAVGVTGGIFPGETTAGNDDAFIRKFDESGNILWTRQFGASGSDKGWGIATDGTRVYACGWVSGNFQGAALGGIDAFVAHYAQDGTNLQGFQFGTAANDNAQAIAVGPGGDLFITGFTAGDYAGPNAGSNDVFVTRYTAGGTEVWRLQFGSVDIDFGYDIAVDASGVYVAADVGGTGVVSKFDLGGVQQWETPLGGGGWSFGVAAHDLYGVYCTGKLQESLFGPYTGLVDAYVARLDPATGNVVWGEQFSSGGDAQVDATGVRVDPTGVYIAGTVEGTALPGESFVGGRDGYVRAYNFSGSELWTKQFGTVTNDFIEGVAAGPVNGETYVFTGGRTTGAGLEGITTALVPANAAADSDGDGIPDVQDSCPAEDATGFDRNNDGCIDEGAGGRHVEYWGEADDNITWVLHEDGAAGVGLGGTLAAVQAAFASWEAVPGKVQSATYGGTTTEAIAVPFDGVNLITFSDTDFSFGSSTLAVGLTYSFTVDSLHNAQFYRANQIVETDMMFNPLQTFTAVGGGGGNHIESVAAHEIGHWWGLSHTAVFTSTMFYVLPPGANAASLSPEDQLAFRKAYPDASTLAANRIEGGVYDELGDPVPGAIVFLTDATTGDTLGCEYTLPQTGKYSFMGIPDGSYFISIHPINGTAPIGYLIPERVNELIAATANTLFVPEYFDAGESNIEPDALARAAVSVAGGTPTTGIDLYLNIDATPPYVVSTDPGDSATDVPVDGAIRVRFSEPINSATLSGNFRLTNMTTLQGVGGQAVFLDDDSLVAFTPDDPLDYSTQYQLDLLPAIEDYFGNAMSDNFFNTFTTEPVPPYGIGGLVPDRGVPGSIVVVNGFDFSAQATDMAVSFDGVSATVLSGNTSELVVVVPAGAGSGDVVVTEATRGSTAPANFTVLPSGETARSIELGAATLGGLPRAVDVVPSGKYAYVATDVGFSSVGVDPADAGFLSVSSHAIPGGLKHLAVKPDGARTLGVSFVGETLSIIDSDDTPGNASFNTVLATLPMSDAPRGIAISAAGSRAYIATDAGEIQVWDISDAVNAFQVGTIASPNSNLRGRMALDPRRNQLLVLTGSGKVLFFDIGTGAFLAEVRVSSDPRDIAMDAAAEQAYVTDADGSVTIISLASRFAVTPKISTGGSLRGVAITPAGRFLYTANRQLNLLEVIDLDVSNASFRTVVNRVPQGVNPVDVDVSPDGLYALSLVEDSRQLVVTSIGVGPAVLSLSRYAGPEGGYVMFAGDGFAADSLVIASFNGLEVTPSSVDDSTVVVPVPSGATSGPAKIIGIQTSGRVVESNEVFFDVLGPTPPGGLRLAAKLAPPGAAAALTTAMSVSPTGNVMVFGGEGGQVWVMDIKPSSPTYNQVVGTFTPVGGEVDDIVVAPDGSRAMVLSSLPDQLVALDVNPLSPDFGTAAPPVDFSSLGSHQNERIAMSPDGRRLLVSDPPNQWVHVVDVDPASPDIYTLRSSLPVGLTTDGNVGEMAFHPAGRYAYLPVRDPDSQTIVIADLWTETIANEYELVGSPPHEAPMDIVFTPDGNTAYLLTSQLLGIDNRSVFTIDTSTPVSPVYVTTQAMGASLGPIPEHITASPRGDRVIYALRGFGFFHAVATPDSVDVLEVTGDVFFHLTGVEMDYSADGNRLYATSQFRDSVFVYDFSTAQSMAIASGNGQLGVIGTELPNPLAVLVTDGGGTPVGGVPVRFEVTAGGGTFVGTASATQVVATGADGIAEVRLRVGGVIGAGAHTVQAWSDGLSGSPLGFSADAVDNPENLPLQITGLLPGNGSTDLSVTTALQATFTRAVNRSSITATSLRLVNTLSGVTVPATVGYAAGDVQVSLTPATPLQLGTSYAFEVGALTDASGGPLLNPTTSVFSTAAAPPPLRLEAVDPPSATAGVTLVLSGTSFDSIPDANTVFFNAIAVTPDAGDVDYLSVTVPVGAATGTVSVQTSTGTSNTIRFTVLQVAEASIDDVLATIGTGNGTKGVSVGPDGAIAYAASPGGGTVVPIDIVGESTYPAIHVGIEPVAIDISPDGKQVFVANLGSGTVSVIDADPASATFHQVVETILVGTAPSDLDVGPDGDRLYVVNALSDNLSVIDSDVSSVTHLQVLATVGTGNSPRGVSVGPDGTILYVGDDQGYEVIDPITYEVLATIGTGRGTKGVSVGPDGGLLYLLTTEGEVLIVDVEAGSATANQVVRVIGTGGGTSSITVSPNGSQLFLVQEESDEILVLNIEVAGSVSLIEDDLPPGRVTVSVADTIMVGEDPAVLVFLPGLPQRALLTSPGDNTVIILSTEPAPLVAEVTVKPRSILIPVDLDSCDPDDDDWWRQWRGRYIRGWIEPDTTGGFTAQDIDIATVRLNGVIPAMPNWPLYGDRDWDGIQELRVIFDRALFQEILPEGDAVPTEISGEFFSGEAFAGTDSIRTYRPLVTSPAGGEILSVGTIQTITWQSPAGKHVDFVDVHVTCDDGESWITVAEGIPDNGSVEWLVPAHFADTCRVMVTLYKDFHKICFAIGAGMSEPFAITMPVAVTMGSVRAVAEDGAAVLQWQTTTEVGVAGFRLHRSEDLDGIYREVSDGLIPSTNINEGNTYEYRDQSVEANRTYYYKLEEVTVRGSGAVYGPYKVTLRLVFALEQNHPNPFNPTTTIKFAIPEAAQVRLEIYDVAGRRVATLVDEHRRAAFYAEQWNGRSDRGDQVASGVYFYRLVAGKHTQTKKMVMLK